MRGTLLEMLVLGLQIYSRYPVAMLVPLPVRMKEAAPRHSLALSRDVNGL